MNKLRARTAGILFGMLVTFNIPFLLIVAVVLGLDKAEKALDALLVATVDIVEICE